MGIVWGLVVAVLGLLAWGGQTVALFAPDPAARWGLTETQDAVEPAFWADVRGEVLWDSLTLWTLPVAGVLLMADAAAWPYFGMIGGAIYVYFGGRGALARREMQRRGLRIGTAANVKAAYIMLSVWGMAGLITILASAMELAD